MIDEAILGTINELRKVVVEMNGNKGIGVSYDDKVDDLCSELTICINSLMGAIIINDEVERLLEFYNVLRAELNESSKLIINESKYI